MGVVRLLEVNVRNKSTHAVRHDIVVMIFQLGGLCDELCKLIGDIEIAQAPIIRKREEVFPLTKFSVLRVWSKVSYWWTFQSGPKNGGNQVARVELFATRSQREPRKVLEGGCVSPNNVVVLVEQLASQNSR